MSILIKGAKMPKNCCECVGAYCDNNRWLCTLAGEYVDRFIYVECGRPTFCPLVDIPPHGRLIDADSIVEDIRECISDDEEILTYNITQQDRERTQLRIELLNDLIDELANAPTVIESEGNNE